jgi:hypothetical protein
MCALRNRRSRRLDDVSKAHPTETVLNHRRVTELALAFAIKLGSRVCTYHERTAIEDVATDIYVTCEKLILLLDDSNLGLASATRNRTREWIVG